jgi:Family of unknown function (DUF5670)
VDIRANPTPLEACHQHHPFSPRRSRHLTATVTAQWAVRLLGWPAWFGGGMLFTIASLLLVVWLLGIFGLYRAGDLVHVLLLVGLMLLLLAFLKAREAAVRRTSGGPPDKR